MNRSYEYRIYPTTEQVSIFNKTLGLCRLYYNLVVAGKTQDHTFRIEGYKPTFTKFKPDALDWIKDVDSMPLGQIWSDVRGAYTNFYASIKGVRKGVTPKPPRFKSKKNPKDSFRYVIQNNAAKIINLTLSNVDDIDALLNSLDLDAIGKVLNKSEAELRQIVKQNI